MVEVPIRTTVDLPDEYGLSSDSLRGSHQFIAPHLVDADDSRDPLTGRPNPRAKLSRNEIRALENTGMLVDENGYEREPEPIVQAAPFPTVQPRVRPQDRAPAGDTKPTPHTQIALDPSPVPKDDDPTRTRRSDNPNAPIPPYTGGVPTPNPQNTAEDPTPPHVNPPTVSD